MEVLELAELIKQIRNRCSACLILIDANATELLATQLEDIHEDSQLIIDEYCVVKDELD
jgi:hypothetical protein